MFIEDNNLYYSYRGLDEDLLDDDTVDRFEKFDESHDIKNLYSGHYVYWNELESYPYNQTMNMYDTNQLVYLDVPKYQGMSYLPPPFWEQYEACIWKVDGNSVAKVRHRYFTPEVRNLIANMLF